MATESASLSALRSSLASGSTAAEAPYAPSTWNQIFSSRHTAPISRSGSTLPVLRDAIPQHIHAHLLVVVHRNPANPLRADAAELRRLLNPRVRFRGRVE